MIRPSSSLTLFWLAAALTLLAVAGCGENKASRFYEDPDPIVAPSSTPPVQAAVDTATDAQPFQVDNGEDDEKEDDQEKTSGDDEKTADGEKPADGADPEKPEPQTAAVDEDEQSPEDTSEGQTTARQKPEKPASRVRTAPKPQPIPSPGSSVPSTAEPAPKRTLPKNSNVVAPGEGAPTNPPTLLQIKQNLDSADTKKSTPARPVIQPEPKPQPSNQIQPKKQPGNVIAPVDLAPMNPQDEDLPPPPKPAGQ